MIVRIATEGQYELQDGELTERLNVLDNEAVAAVEAGDEAAFADRFAQILAFVREHGTRLDANDLRGSDVIVPPPDISFEEARSDFSGDGLIPD